MCVAVRDLYMSWYFLKILLQNTVLNQKYILTKLYLKEKKKNLECSGIYFDGASS